jgi:hypothetical protein
MAVCDNLFVIVLVLHSHHVLIHCPLIALKFRFELFKNIHYARDAREGRRCVITNHFGLHRFKVLIALLIVSVVLKKLSIDRMTEEVFFFFSDL